MKHSLVLGLLICCTAALFAADCQDGPYGLQINGSTVVDAPKYGDKDAQGRVQYKAACVALNVGDVVKLINTSCDATWMVDIDPYGEYQSFTGGKSTGYITCGKKGNYDVYIKLKNNDDLVYIGPGENCGETPPTPGPDYSTAVPSQCGDVMLQAFYWDSSADKGYGDTRWSTLKGQAEEIGTYFSLVWLPPSSKPSYISSKLGYIADDYSNQASNLGTKVFLVKLIDALHTNHVKVLADIVINHCGNYNSKCNFFELNFGSYGKIQPNETWITGDDEEACNPSGNKDDGQHDANYAAARDWDHKNTNVQNMCRTYLKWMKTEMNYDGFRFDYCGGYHVSHVNDYVSAAKPYFSVMEYWDGNADNLKSRIDDASKNTLTFDFAQMYTAFQQGIVTGTYSKCVKPGLRGKGYEKYAVTFVDNHDTFNRGEDQADVMGKRDGSSINDAAVMLQCNAYLLAMPGVPCIFYPHWVKYKTELKEMIKARWIAGVHSESKVQEESGSGYYKATITGKTGEIRLLLGPNSGFANTPAGFTKAYAGNNCGLYYKGTGAWPRETSTGLDPVPAQPQSAAGKKFMKDGHLYIQVGETIYTMQGQVVK